MKSSLLGSPGKTLVKAVVIGLLGVTTVGASLALAAVPDPGPEPATLIGSDFVRDNDLIVARAVVAGTGQTVTRSAGCATKTRSQFKQQTQKVCKLKEFNRGKCKSGDLLPGGGTQP